MENIHQAEFIWQKIVHWENKFYFTFSNVIGDTFLESIGTTHFDFNHDAQKLHSIKIRHLKEFKRKSLTNFKNKFKKFCIKSMSKAIR